ncbi:MAG: response regulator transcription factor [Bacteroidota bacterium]
MKILIVEDDPKIAAFLKQGLEEQSYETDIAYDGMAGKRMALSNEYDCLIVDLNLPYVNGLELIRTIREARSKAPVLVLSGFSQTEDKVAAFDAGADQYMTKPFEFRELLARLRALYKRSKDMMHSSTILRAADLELDLEAKTVRRAGRQIELTTKEFALLEFLMRNKGRTVSRVDISEKVWEVQFDTGTNLIDVYVNYLRRKIDRDFPSKLIHTVVGMGYQLKER